MSFMMTSGGVSIENIDRMNLVREMRRIVVEKLAIIDDVTAIAHTTVPHQYLTQRTCSGRNIYTNLTSVVWLKFMARIGKNGVYRGEIICSVRICKSAIKISQIVSTEQAKNHKVEIRIFRFELTKGDINSNNLSKGHLCRSCFLITHAQKNQFHSWAKMVAKQIKDCCLNHPVNFFSVFYVLCVWLIFFAGDNYFRFHPSWWTILFLIIHIGVAAVIDIAISHSKQIVWNSTFDS